MSFRHTSKVLVCRDRLKDGEDNESQKKEQVENKNRSRVIVEVEEY